MKKIIFIFLLSITIFTISCKKESNTIINNIYEYEISDNEIQSINNLDDVLNVISNKVSSSCVALEVKHSSGLINNTGIGSGVIIKKVDNDYYVLTCRHVLFNNTNTLCDDIKIYLNGAYFNCEVVSYDNDVDIALVKFSCDLNLPIVKLAEEVKLGKYVISCSTMISLDYYNSISIGNISHLDRTITEKNIQSKDVVNHYFQHTATINNGSSGGGLFNLNGELIGISDWKLNNSENMNFGISVNIIREFLNNINDWKN